MELKNKKKVKVSQNEYSEHSEHSESCGCESVTGITEEDMQERE
jgi:hypothetical protein